MTKKILSGLLFLAVFNITLSQGQITKFTPEDFELSGQTVRLGDNCFRLTPDQQWSSGSLWNRSPIDLKSSFEMEIDVNLGCKDSDGADGIVFMFYPYSRRTGYQGEGMGFGGLKPSLGIELDTWENDHLGDPHYDHMAIMANGNVAHYHNLSTPVPIKSNRGNVEDCKKHRLKVRWKAGIQTLAVFFDGELRMSLKKDLVTQIFRGRSNVYWGFSSATGGFNNIHEVCLEKLEIITVDSPEFEPEITKNLLKGDCIDLKNIEFEAGKTALKSESKKELEKLVLLLKDHPQHKLLLYGHTDSSGSQAVNKTLSQKRANAVKNYLISKGIKEKRIGAFGMGEDYPKTSNSTAAGRKENRRIQICVSKPRA